MPPTRLLRTLATAAAALAATTGRAHAQFGPPNMGLGPQLPKSGAIARDTAYERKVLEQMKAPEGFTMTLFAGPPVAMYPTVVTPAPDGSVYVGVDLNLAQGAVKGRGRVMRLVDTDGDGRADRYTTFLDVDSPRGIVADGKTVYVLHPPNLTAYHDTNGDGIADDSTDLVKNIGFSLDVRSSDHATNNITLGPDGWIYIANGDYGHLNATGKDGTTITRHGGSVARVRTDGTGLEDYAVGTRNIYDVGIDPLGHVFARDNTNDGGGWDTRFHYLAPMANMGYPSLFKNFPQEHMQSIADYGAGSGTAGLWIQDPGFPDQWNNTLYTGDWTVNKVLHNHPTKKGGSYTVAQEDFMAVPRAIDIAMDDRSHLYVASLIGGVFNYAGDTVGAIVRVSYPGRRPAAALEPEKRTDEQLLDELISPNAVHRSWAQQEILRRGPKSATERRLERAMLDPQRSADARAAALFTLKLLAGERSHVAIQKAVTDPVTREVALRTLVDDKRQLKNVPASLYVQALSDPDLAVRIQGMRGLVRLGATSQAAAIAPLLDSPDSAVAHIAVQSLAALGARDVALRALATGGPQLRTRARFALQQMHDPATVDAVSAAYAQASDPAVKRELLLTLARLYNTDAPWNGDWWGTHPSTVGPYFAPATWEQSARIKPVLLESLGPAHGADFVSLVDALVRNRVVPAGAKPLILAISEDTALRGQVAEALVGTSTLSPAAVALLPQLNARGGALRAAVAELIAGETGYDAQTLPLARAVALDASVDAATRGRVLTTISQLPGDAGRDAAADVFARLSPRVPASAATATPVARTPGDPGAGVPGGGVTTTGAPGPGGTPPQPIANTPTNPAGAGAPPAGPGGGAADPVEAAWRRYVGDRQRTQQLDYFVNLARTGDPAQRTLAYAVLVQAVRNPRAPQAIRDQVTPVITAAWTDPAAARSLVDAITIMRVESQYAEQLRAYTAMKVQK